VKRTTALLLILRCYGNGQTPAEADAIRSGLAVIQEKTAASRMIVDSAIKPQAWKDLVRASMAEVAIKAAEVAAAAAAARSTSIFAPDTASFRSAIQNAQPGDVITLQAGAVYSGNFVLPKKAGDGWITITTSELAALAGVKRVGPEHTKLLPKIIAPPGFAGISVASGAHHYRIIGVEITGRPDVYAAQLVQVGTDGDTTEAQLAHSIDFDKLFVHGDPVSGAKRGFQLNGRKISVTNSTVLDIKSNWQETQAVSWWNTTGEIRIANNRLEAAGMAILSGGAEPVLRGVTPTNIIIENNVLSRPLAWRAQKLMVKNLLELKTGRDVMIRGNIIENAWASSQVGYAINLKAGAENVITPAVTRHVVLENNTIRNAAGGIIIGGSNSVGGKLSDVTIRNNLFDNLGPAWGSTLNLFTVGRVENLRIEYNTATASVTPNAVLYGSGIAPSLGLVFRSNIFPIGTFGVKASSMGEGTSTFAKEFIGADFSTNVLFGDTAATRRAKYPHNNYWVDSPVEIGWAASSYKLAPTSTFSGAGAGGTNPGVDYDLLLAATQGVAAGR
jgi:hypothetical protein